MKEEAGMSIVSITDIFTKISGLKITYASIADSIVTIVIDKVWTLTIYNKSIMLLNGLLSGGIDTNILSNSTLLSVTESDSKLVIHLSNNISLIVDLSDEGFSGPEAMQLVGPDNLIMVWS